MALKDYQRETLIRLREMYPEILCHYTDDEIASTYGEWSDWAHAAGWVGLTDGFIDWAFCNPMNRHKHQLEKNRRKNG